jgi:hypothetical protein
MRLWVFDKYGPYSSEKFYTHKEPERVVRCVWGRGREAEKRIEKTTQIGSAGAAEYTPVIRAVLANRACSTI